MDPSQMKHFELMMMRNRNPALLDQQLLAPFEHRAFARELAQEHPFKASVLLGAIPAYQGAKSLGLVGSRTQDSQSLDQMFAGFHGLGEGWAQVIQNLRNNQQPFDEVFEGLNNIFDF